MEDFELTLYDRLEAIRSTIKQYGEDNFYISFSGGKDSTITSYLVDMALPNNKIPRVFFNTGIEYNDVVLFVKELAKNDDRVQIYTPHVKINQMLKKEGYPFKSKAHSHILGVYQRNGKTKYIERYLKGVRPDDKTPSYFKCPSYLTYQFEKDGVDFKVSEKCCDRLKKDTAHQWERKNGKHIAILGLRVAEKGSRSMRKGCLAFDTKDKSKLIRFKPINPCSDEFCQWFIKKYDIKLCKLYYPPYSFDRVGCKGCPFALNLQEELDKMEKLLPNERKQCELLWEPTYTEYRKIGYRLRKEEDNGK